MNEKAMEELDYGVSIAIQTLIEALGMHWTNENQKMRGQIIPYKENDFKDLIERHGIHHNAIINRWNHVR